MTLRNWLRSLFTRHSSPARTPRRASFRPRLEVLEDRALPSAGALDPTFGSGGLVTTDVLAGASESANDLVAQSDGKLVVAGKAGSQAFVARYNGDGGLDSTFGSGGKAILGIRNIVNNSGNALAVQGDGKYVVAGSAYTSQSFDFFVFRLNANGTLDKTFDKDGIVTTGFTNSSQDTATQVVVLPGGKILVGGTTDSAGGFALARYNANGSLDTSFGNAGKRIYNNTSGVLVSMAVQADGKVVMAGRTADEYGYLFVTLLRINSDGNSDTTFGSGGVVTTQLPDQGNTPFDLALAPDGKIVVVGDASVTGTGYHQMILRYNTNGSLDSSFDGDGAQNSARGVARSVVVQTDGKIITAGHTQIAFGANSQTDLILTRYNANGSLDASFGTDGQVVSTLIAGPEQVNAVAVQADGKIIVAANKQQDTLGKYELTVLARYLPATPQIGSFAANPNPLTAGNPLTLTAANVQALNPGSTITQVAFYQDSNGDGMLQPGTDALLGYGTKNTDGTWTLTFSTTGWASGSYTLFAQTLDSYGVFSDPLAATAQLN